jgi:hypothetical protein
MPEVTLRNEVDNLIDNHGIIYIANEGRHVKMVIPYWFSCSVIFVLYEYHNKGNFISITTITIKMQYLILVVTMR